MRRSRVVLANLWAVRSRTSHYGLLMISDLIASLRLGRGAAEVLEGPHMLAHRGSEVLRFDETQIPPA